MTGNRGTEEQRASGHRRRATRPSEANDEVSLVELGRIVYRRRLPLLICVAAGVAIAGVVSLVLPKRYEATGRLTVSFDQSPSSGAEALAQAAGVSDPAKLQTQVNLLTTDALAWETIKELRLDQQQDALPREYGIGPPRCATPSGTPADSVSALCKRMLLDEFHQRLHVQALPRTEIIEISYRSRSPQLAEQVVTALAAIYQDRIFQAGYRSSMRASDWLAGQVQALRRESETAEQKLLEFEKHSGQIATESGQSLQLTQLGGLSQQLLAARSQRIAQEARYQTALSGDPEALIGIPQDSTLQALHASEVALGNQFAQLHARYGDAYPRVVQMKEELAEAHRATSVELDHQRREIGQEFAAAQRAEDLASEAFEAQKRAIADRGEASLQLALLRRDAEASNELYEQVLRRMRMSGITAGINGLDVDVVDPPLLPVHKAEPHPALNLLGGLAMGTLLGLGLCGVLEATDPRIGTLHDVRRLWTIPGAGAVPRFAGRPLFLSPSGLHGVEALEHPAGAAAEWFRGLRTTLLHRKGSCEPRVILFTSARAGEGKSHAAANLATVLARANKRVLLVDGDLHGGGFSASLPAPGGGLLDLLLGRGERVELVAQAELPALQALAAGSASGAGDLLDSDSMRALVASWRERFDFVVVEAPHVLGLSDAPILATMADAVLMAVRVGYGRGPDLESARESLLGAGATVSAAMVVEGDEPEAPAEHQRNRSEQANAVH